MGACEVQRYEISRDFRNDSLSFCTFFKINFASLFEKCIFTAGKIIEKCSF